MENYNVGTMFNSSIYILSTTDYSREQSAALEDRLIIYLDILTKTVTEFL